MTAYDLIMDPAALRAARTLTEEQVHDLAVEHDRDDVTAAERWTEKSGH